MKRSIKYMQLLALLYISGSAATAQDSITTDQVRRLLIAQNAPELLKRGFLANVDTTDLSSEQAELYKTFIEQVDSFGIEVLLPLMLPYYSRHLSPEDIENVIVFYQTETGRKMAEMTLEARQEQAFLSREFVSAMLLHAQSRLAGVKADTVERGRDMRLVGSWEGYSEGEKGAFIFAEDGIVTIVMEGDTIGGRDRLYEGTRMQMHWYTRQHDAISTLEMIWTLYETEIVISRINAAYRFVDAETILVSMDFRSDEVPQSFDPEKYDVIECKKTK